jgi:predicted deacylase
VDTGGPTSPDSLPPFVRPEIVEHLDLEAFEPGRVHRVRLAMTQNASGNETLLPIFVARSAEPGPAVAVTAAIHGNELNGIPVVHQLMHLLGTEPFALLRGTIIAAPILNVPGYLNFTRTFEDGADLNRLMPGRADGNESELYAHRIIDRIVRHCDYLIDLHTASFGRANTHYVRCDMRSRIVLRMATLLGPQIIVHSPNADGTLRGAAADRGIHAVTVEVGDPHRFQGKLVRSAGLGLLEVLADLDMLPETAAAPVEDPIRCARSFWIHTDRGGLLRVLPELGARVEAAEVVATLQNAWGDLVRHYRAPEDGVVIGLSTNPAARAGSRILHIGVIGSPS